MKAKVLLIYPTLYKISGLHFGLGTLSAVLKKYGHDVKIFNNTFYPDKRQEDQNKFRSDIGMTKTIDNLEQYLPDNDSDLKNDLINLINDYKPDIIGISIFELVFKISIIITRIIKKNFINIPIIAGGVFTTLSPEIVIDEPSIDMICVGEGENVLKELCEGIKKSTKITKIKGLWVKDGDKVYKNEPSLNHNINDCPHPDYSEFDERLFYQPMQGKMYKMVNVSTSRGCAFNCTFCSAPNLRRVFKKNDCGPYFRKLSMEKAIDQIHYQVKKHNPEFLFFSSLSFLSGTDKEFEMFIKEYEKIRIPFWIQTRVETITKERLEKLKNVGMKWLSIGLEHGNEEFRKRVLKRNYSNECFITKMDVLRELNIGASINNIIGFPGETREHIFDAIRVNRQLWMKNQKLESNIFILAPYRGCELYEICKKEGLMDHIDYLSTDVIDGKSMLSFPEKHQEDLKGLLRTFNLYIKLPEKFYNQIRIAERSDPEGDRMLRKLVAEIT